VATSADLHTEATLMPESRLRRWRAVYVLIGVVLVVLIVRLLLPDVFHEYTRGTLKSLRRWSAEPSGR
jgi:hypothetical protein